MPRDILSQIVERRASDIARLGVSLGVEIPAERKRALHPFVQEKGVILEVKRASPSKGDIAPNLDAAQTALAYQKAGAAATSVLTESNWFKGSLEDLKKVAAAVDIAVLRKDFLIYPDEIDVAYKCGADAVLLIARILEKEVFAKMLERTAAFGMAAFVELRLADDLQKLVEAKKLAGANVPTIVCGVNARDLKDFSIDLLSPSGFLEEIKAAMGRGCNVVFESGIRSAQAASFAGSLGFAGLLLGEAAARDTSAAASFVQAFVSRTETLNALAWKKIAAKIANCRKAKKPLVKICGLTNKEDAMAAADFGADLLGFVFCEASPRNASESVVCEVRAALQDLSQAKKAAPLLVGVVIDTTSQQAKTALSLARQGILDFVQLHGERAAQEFFADKENLSLAHYCAANLSGDSGANVGGGENCAGVLDKIQGLLNLGEPRVLIDAKVGGKVGGTGTQVAEDLVLKAKKKSPLWLAGGLSADNVRDIMEKYSPELIDASSLLEAAPGKKDLGKLKAFFAEIGAAFAGGAQSLACE